MDDSMIPKLIILEEISEGSTFPGLELVINETFIAEGETELTVIPVDLTGATVIAQFKQGNNVCDTYTNTDSSLLIDGNTITMPEHIPKLKYGLYDFDFNITLSDGLKITGFAKGQWRILNPITKL